MDSARIEDEVFKYDSPFLEIKMKESENERSIDSYYFLMGLMNNREKMYQLVRLKNLLENEMKNDFSIMVKLGIARRYFLCDNCMIEYVIQEFFSGSTDGRRLFREANEVDPHHELVLHDTALTYLVFKEEDKYLEIVDLLKQNHPQSPYIFILEAKYLTMKEKYDKAFDILSNNIEELSKRKPTHMFAMSQFCRILQLKKDEVRLVESYNEFINTMGNLSEWGLRSLGYHYMKKCGECADLEYLKKARALFQRGLVFSVHGFYYPLALMKYFLKEFESLDEVMELLDLELATDPFSVASYLLKIRIALNHDLAGDIEEVIRNCDKVIQLDPERYGVYLQKAKYQSLQEEIRFLEQTVSKVEKNELKLSRSKGIRKIYERLHEIMVGENNFERALEFCSKAIEADPDHPKGYRDRAFVHLRMESFYKAIEDFDRLSNHRLEIAPNRGVYSKFFVYDQYLHDFDNSWKNLKIYIRQLRRFVCFEPNERYVKSKYCKYHLEAIEFLETYEKYGKEYRFIKRTQSYMATIIGKMKKKEEEEQSCYSMITQFDSILENKKMEMVKKYGVGYLLGDKGSRRNNLDFKERCDFLTQKEEEVDEVVKIHGEKKLYVLCVFKFLRKFEVV